MDKLKSLFNSDHGTTGSRTPFTDAAQTCPFPLGDETAASITLSDGRKLGYCEYGSPTGDVILYLHGLPTSRKDAASYDPTAKELGIRIIAIDRPGIGLSSPAPNRSILDHAEQVRQLTEHLKLTHYAVVGCSAGGPYALACALALPSDKLKAVTVAGGSGPPQAGKQGMQWRNRIGFSILPYLPFVCRWFYQASPLGRLDISDDERFLLFKKQNRILDINGKETDDVLQDDNYLLVQLRSCREAFRQGFDGSVLDAQLISSDWGFKIEDIRQDLPIELWYGKDDEHVPFHCGEYIASRLGKNARFVACKEGHLGVILRQSPEWLRSTVNTLRGTA